MSAPLSQLDGDEETTVELYCRASLPNAAAIGRYHDRVAELEDDGVIDAVDTHAWPSRVEFDVEESVALEAYGRFRAWAAREGVDLEPAFEAKRYESAFTGERGRRLTTPVVCLAVYADDYLAAVYPHVDGDEVRTVEDGLDALSETVEATAEVTPRTRGPDQAIAEPSE